MLLNYPKTLIITSFIISTRVFPDEVIFTDPYLHYNFNKIFYLDVFYPTLFELVDDIKKLIYKLELELYI